MAVYQLLSQPEKDEAQRRVQEAKSSEEEERQKGIHTEMEENEVAEGPVEEGRDPEARGSSEVVPPRKKKKEKAGPEQLAANEPKCSSDSSAVPNVRKCAQQ